MTKREGDMDSREPIDWTRTDGFVVFPSAQGIAIYANAAGSISIVQEGSYPDDDVLITIPVIQVGKVIAALRREAAEIRSAGK